MTVCLKRERKKGVCIRAVYGNPSSDGKQFCYHFRMATKRVFNFSSGPAVLPLPVLEAAQSDLVALPGVGMSVLEISHRSKVFDDIFQEACDEVRQVGNIPSNYKILMLQGGASL